jgi:Asp/Glu/hydantoin racemase
VRDRAVPLVAAVYTGRGLDQQIAAVATEVLGSARLMTILDDTLIFDINREGVTPAVTRRVLRYYENAQDAGAAVVLNTCSSVGELVELGRAVVAVPIVRIDEPMAEEAVRDFGRIGVVATLESTLGPTRRLLQAKADANGRRVELVTRVANEAYQALAGGDAEKHDSLVANEVAALSTEVETVVLAQASMARIRDRLEAVAGVPVLTSLRSGLEAVKRALAFSTLSAPDA